VLPVIASVDARVPGDTDRQKRTTVISSRDSNIQLADQGELPPDCDSHIRRAHPVAAVFAP